MSDDAARLKNLASLNATVTSSDLRPYLALDAIESWTGKLAAHAGLEIRSPGSGMASVEPGDVLFGKLRPYLAKAWVADRPAYASTELLCMRPVERTDSRWLGYVLLSLPFVRFAEATSDGTKMPRTSWEKMSSYRLRPPRLAEQRDIADFLDVETTRIDALISKKRRLLELLDERRRSLIDRVTTRGTLVRIRYLTSLITSGPRGWSDRVGDTGDAFVRSANLMRDAIELRLDNIARVEAPENPEAERSRLLTGDVLVGITGANTGWVGLVPPELSAGFVSQHVAVLRAAGISPQWMAFSLFSYRIQGDLIARQYGGTKQQLGLQDLAELVIHVPSDSEQEGMVTMLAEMENRRFEISSRMNRHIGLLSEHRKALITAAVAGELDIALMIAEEAS